MTGQHPPGVAAGPAATPDPANTVQGSETREQRNELRVAEELLQCRSMADRIDAARRMPPLPDGRRDPDDRHPTDAPDDNYRLWQLAQQLADAPTAGSDE